MNLQRSNFFIMKAWRQDSAKKKKSIPTRFPGTNLTRKTASLCKYDTVKLSVATFGLLKFPKLLF